MQNPQIFPTVDQIEQALKKAREPEYFYDSALFPPPPPFPQEEPRPFYQVKPYPQITFKVKTLVYRQLLSQNFPDTPPDPTNIWVPPPNIINNLRNVTVWVEFVGRSLKDEEEFTLYGSEAIKLYKQLPYLNRAISVWSCAPAYAQETEFYLEVIYFGIPKLEANAEQSFRVDNQHRYAISPLKGYSDGYSFFTIPTINAFPDLLFTYKDNKVKYVYTSLNNNSNVPLTVIIAGTTYTVLPQRSFQNYTVFKHGQTLSIRSAQPSDFIQGAIFGSIATNGEPIPTVTPRYTPVATPTPSPSPSPTQTPTPTPSPSQVHVCMPSVVLTEIKGEPPIYTFNNICGPKGLGIGTYTFLNVPAEYAIGFLNNKDVTVSGTYSLGTHLGPQGGVYEFFFDTVTLNVKKDFHSMSYFSYPSKQYLGGYNSMIFDPNCVITPTRTPSATWRPVPLPTPRPTPPPTATLEPYPEVIIVK
jgi:hypothetical protein